MVGIATAAAIAKEFQKFLDIDSSPFSLGETLFAPIVICKFKVRLINLQSVNHP
jgi:hypothetical protein